MLSREVGNPYRPSPVLVFPPNCMLHITSCTEDIGCDTSSPSSLSATLFLTSVQVDRAQCSFSRLTQSKVLTLALNAGCSAAQLPGYPAIVWVEFLSHSCSHVQAGHLGVLRRLCFAAGGPSAQVQLCVRREGLQGGLQP